MKYIFILNGQVWMNHFNAACIFLNNWLILYLLKGSSCTGKTREIMIADTWAIVPIGNYQFLERRSFFQKCITPNRYRMAVIMISPNIPHISQYISTLFFCKYGILSSGFKIPYIYMYIEKSSHYYSCVNVDIQTWPPFLKGHGVTISLQIEGHWLRYWQH